MYLFFYVAEIQITMEGTLSAGVNSDSSFPIEVFLNLIENHETTEGSWLCLSEKDLINFTLSSFDTSALDDTKLFSELQDLNEWTHFKSEMVRIFRREETLKGKVSFGILLPSKWNQFLRMLALH